MNKRRPPEKPRKFPSRNTAALVLFGRSVVITLSIVSGCIGFYAGIQSSSASYNPHNYATGAGALFAAACAVIAFMLTRRRATKVKLRALELRIEELSDRNWELREAEVRARSLLEAQGDLIIRRDAQGLLTYANDAYCTLAGKSRAQLLGQPAALTVHEQGPATMLADGTRAHDQKIAMGDNAAGSPGAKSPYAPRPAPKCKASAAMSPTGSRRNAPLPRRAIWRKPPTAPSRASSPWSAMKSAHHSMACSAWPICCSTPV